MKNDGLVVEGEQGGFSAEDNARAAAILNNSQSTTDAGRFRLIEAMLERRATDLAEREKRLLEQEIGSDTAVRKAEIEARAAGMKLLEEASTKASAIVGAAVDEAGQILMKVNVEAGVLRQATQDHLVAGLALADTARLPPPTPPSPGQLFAKLGETLGSKALGVFEKLMLANPEATARLAGGIADTFGSAEGKPAGPTFGEVAAAVAILGRDWVAEFLGKRGLQEMDGLLLADGAVLVEAAAEKKKAESAHV